MANLSRHRVLIAGLVSPVAAIALVVGISYGFEHWARDFPASASAFLPIVFICTAVPFLVTAFLASNEYRRQALTVSGKIGIAVAALSLICPIWAAYAQLFAWRAAWNLNRHDVPAPIFSTLDVDGTMRSLNDEKGKVVLVNVWATWCASCVAEMPELDGFYREHKDEGLVIFGLSNEDAAVQKKCVENRPVSYPCSRTRDKYPESIGRSQCIRLPS